VKRTVSALLIGLAVTAAHAAPPVEISPAKFKYEDGKLNYVVQAVNNGGTRAKGYMCITAYDKDGFVIQALPDPEVNMGVGDSESITGYLYLNRKELHETKKITVRLSPYGCIDPIGDAISTVQVRNVTDNQ
jgi:hypothetical protein